MFGIRREIVRSKLLRWLDYVNDFVEKGIVYDNDAIVKQLVDNRGPEESVDFLYYLFVEYTDRRDDAVRASTVVSMA